MAGVDMANDSGTPIKMATVPTIDGSENEAPGMGKAKVVESAHLHEYQTEVNYPAEPMSKLDETSGYPAGTDFGEANNPLKP